MSEKLTMHFLKLLEIVSLYAFQRLDNSVLLIFRLENELLIKEGQKFYVKEEFEFFLIRQETKKNANI